MPHWWICGASRIERLADVEERGPFLVGDLDRLDGRECDGLRVGGDSCDRLALVANLAVSEQRLVGWNPEAFEVPVDVLRHIGVRHNRAYARQRLGLAGVERGDDRMVMRRAERLHPEVLTDANIVDVLRAAGDMADAVVPWEACADGLHAALPLAAASCSAEPRRVTRR